MDAGQADVVENVLDDSAETQDTFLDMSDEDFANLPDDQFVPPSEESSEAQAPADADDDDSNVDYDEDDDDDQEESDDADTDQKEEEEDSDDDEEESDEENKDEASEDDKEEDKSEVDYKAEFERLTSPFRANGKEMNVDNVDDAIKLMQMGANYNRKMAAMKPGLKVLKMLEKNELLDEGKLNFLIDLDKKDPAAIKKLVKDSNIDYMDLDSENDDGKEYKSKQYGVDDREMELDSVLEELQETDTYSKTLDIVGSQWDDKSKQIVADQPNLLRNLNVHVANGVYDLVSTEVERERSFGRLGGVSDFEAYQQVGERMGQEGKFDYLDSQKEPANSKTTSPKPTPTKPKVDDSKRRAKRKAASATKTAAGKTVQQDFNPLALSDEEFLKQTDPRLM